MNLKEKLNKFKIKKKKTKIIKRSKLSMKILFKIFFIYPEQNFFCMFNVYYTKIDKNIKSLKM